MRSIKAFIQGNPAASYFALTFAISWGGILVVMATHGVPTMEEFMRLIPIWAPVLVLGPSIAGVLMTWLVAGGPGLREFRSRLFAWRVGARWYAAALLIAPLYFTAVGLACSVFYPELLPGIFVADDKVAHLTRGLVVALTAGVFEELGWTGFAIPTLRRRYGPMSTGLIVGGLWGAWHFLPKIWGAAAHDLVAYLPVDLSCALLSLTGFRILMVWVYDATQSLLVAMLMHMSLTASTLILQPLVTGAPLMRIVVALTAAPWAIVGAVAVVKHWRSANDVQRWTHPLT